MIAEISAISGQNIFINVYPEEKDLNRMLIFLDVKPFQISKFLKIHIGHINNYDDLNYNIAEERIHATSSQQSINQFRITVAKKYSIVMMEIWLHHDNIWALRYDSVLKSEIWLQDTLYNISVLKQCLHEEELIL